MNCHDPSSHWKLVGVYKESVEFDNDTFFEQLFKHQGYCLWDGDKEDNDDWGDSDYQFMQAMREAMPSGCEKTSLFSRYSGSSHYIDIMPLSKGTIEDTSANQKSVSSVVSPS